jgi:heme-degrading monooxygenase HmoA
MMLLSLDGGRERRTTMIIRVFQVQVQPGMRGDFERFLREVAIPRLQAQAGLLQLHVGTPREETPDEFAVILMWEDLTSLQAFTGPQWREAVILPEEAHLLKSTHLHHYQSLF